MAIKATAQQTLLDISDAYNVLLTSESFTFVGNTSGAPANSTCTTDVVGYLGSTQLTSISVTASEITFKKADGTPATGVSAAVTNNGTSVVTITFTTTATLTEAIEANIPVHLDDVTYNKKFSMAVAKTGADAVAMTITASNGTIFKNNNGSTVLTAHVYVGGVEKPITDAGVCAGVGTIKWYISTNMSTAVSTSKTLTVTAQSVTNSISYVAQCEA